MCFQVRFPESLGSIRTLVCQSKTDVNLYVGTTANCILEGSVARKFSVAVWGHARRLDAIAVHPDEFSFVTAGHDKVIVNDMILEIYRIKSFYL